MARYVGPTVDAPDRSALGDLLRQQGRHARGQAFPGTVAVGTRWRIEQAMTAGDEAGGYQPGDLVVVHGPSGTVAAVLARTP